MAIRKVNAESVSRWNSKMPFAKDNYIIRCYAEKIGVSSNKNPMATLDWEICNASPTKLGDEIIDVDGVKFTTYHVLKVLPNKDLSEEDAKKKSDTCFKAYQERVLMPCGVDVSEGWDDENPPSVKGKVVHALLYGEESVARKLDEDGKYVNIKDPLTKKEVKTTQIKMDQIYGLFEGTVDRPF